MLVLEVIAGEADAHRQFRIRPGERRTLGRVAQRCVLRDTRVSRRHAQVEYTAAGWVLADQGSQHGTLVNGERIARPVVLQPGDRIQIGRVVLKVTQADAAEPLHQPETATSSRDETSRAKPAPARTPRGLKRSPVLAIEPAAEAHPQGAEVPSTESETTPATTALGQPLATVSPASDAAKRGQYLARVVDRCRFPEPSSKAQAIHANASPPAAYGSQCPIGTVLAVIIEPTPAAAPPPAGESSEQVPSVDKSHAQQTPQSTPQPRLGARLGEVRQRPGATTPASSKACPSSSGVLAQIREVSVRSQSDGDLGESDVSSDGLDTDERAVPTAGNPAHANENPEPAPVTTADETNDPSLPETERVTPAATGEVAAPVRWHAGTDPLMANLHIIFPREVETAEARRQRRTQASLPQNGVPGEQS
jgi:hypothetical protein